MKSKTVPAISIEAYRDPDQTHPEIIARIQRKFSGAHISRQNKYTLLFYYPPTFKLEEDRKIFEGLYNDEIIQSWKPVDVEAPDNEGKLQKRTLHDIGLKVREGRLLTPGQAVFLLDAYLDLEKHLIEARAEADEVTGSLYAKADLLELRNTEIHMLYDVLKAVFQIEVFGHGMDSEGRLLTKVKHTPTGQILGENAVEGEALKQGLITWLKTYAKE